MKKLKKTLAILCCILTAGTASAFNYASAASAQIVLNEVCAKNTSYLAPDGCYYDWIELYNPSSLVVDLSGYGLSDKTDKPYQYTFPEGTVISGGGRLIVFCDSVAEEQNGMLVAPFGLSKDGETVTLTDPNGNLVDTVTFGAMETNMTYGRSPDGSDTMAYMEMTPDAANKADTVVKKDVAEPVFSQESGFYDTAFQLSLTAPEGYTIRYTLDGSEPTEESAVYSSPISVTDISNQPNLLSARTDISAPSQWGGISAPASTVDKAFIIRAAAFDESGNRSGVVSGSYFIGFDSKADYYDDFKVISIVTDSDNLFDYEDGIYILGKTYDEWLDSDDYDSSTPEWWVPANYTQKGAEWEREATMQIFENGSLSVNQNVGVRIHGGATRVYPQKSLNIYARSEYGASKLDFDLFSGSVTNQYDGSAITEFDSFMLRNGGNDAQYSRFRDKLNQTLVSDRSITVQGMEPCIVFIDGEYWGQYEITEKISDDFISSHYGVKKKNVCIIKNEELDDGDEEGFDEFTQLWEWINATDFSSDESYTELCEKIDMQSFADYITAEIYYNNSDWGDNNMAMWKSMVTDTENPYADGRWRFILFDTEYSVNLYGQAGASTNTFSQVTGSDCFLSDLYRSAMENESFRKQFCITFMDMANENFDSARISQLIGEIADAYHDSTIDTYNRFWPYWPGGYLAEKSLSSEVGTVKTFYNNRFSSITSLLKNAASLNGNMATVMLKNDDSKGTVKLNTITPDFSGGSWSGEYYTDYSVTVAAEPQSGYQFAYFETSTGEKYYTNEVEISFNSDITITAVYEETDEVIGDVNADGIFDVSDVVMLQKWLLCVGGIKDWKAGDLCEDGVLNVFDLCLMKRMLL